MTQTMSRLDDGERFEGEECLGFVLFDCLVLPGSIDFKDTIV
jgi:hypothetical protein